MKKISFLFLSVILILIACNSTQKIATANSNGKHVFYSDGNGNNYSVSNESFEYTPVKLGESSTGIYDGGTPVKNKPQPEKFQKLADLAASASTAIFDHMHNREKGTGQVTIRDGAKTVSFILKMGSTWQIQIENLLKEMKSSGI